MLEIRALRAYLGNDPVERNNILREAMSTGDLVRDGVLEAALLYAQNFDAAAELVALSKAWLSDTLTRRYGLMGLSTLSLGRGHIESRATEPSLGKLLQPAWLLESEAFVAADPFFHASRARIATLRDGVARLPYRMTGFPVVRR